VSAAPPLHTSTAFASVLASGADWREVGRKILESLESIRTEGDGMNVGFLYTTAELGSDLTSLLTLLKNVTRINAWYGATGQGVCGSGLSLSGWPAASAMIGRLPEGSFSGFMLPDNVAAPLPENVRAWMAGHTPVAALTHGILCAQGAQRLKHFRDRDGLFAIGGFSGATPGGAHVCDGQVVRSGDPLSGVLLDSSVRVMTATSFGCTHAGHVGCITKCAGNVIEMIDDIPACEFLQNAIETLDIGKGHVHAAFPIAGSDHKNFLMRNITEVDDASGTITVAHNFERGDAIEFVHRDRQSAATDLTQTLTGLYGRAADEIGAANLKPKAILYFGCGARIPANPEQGGADTDEAQLIKNVFSDVPMAGFYTAAEICNGHVYGYTGVIVLFL
jgi:small ligand-binding sensory domain FIST